MRKAWPQLRSSMSQFWQGIREWSGDAAYEQYRKSMMRAGREMPLTATEFYVEQLNRKYSRPNRCC